ncbi:hypothetical protein CC78DRAFT_601883 [Lojkania enalia]|uniref:Uncharacterized protein n=1 Tax=Lojkania enalia TaxID=147567 RepID=A0A9P4TPP6_9PLEO|nr:hypothetical protein CC78DRAFT_601883 [Didymosphaeria enalia]
MARLSPENWASQGATPPSMSKRVTAFFKSRKSEGMPDSPSTSSLNSKLKKIGFQKVGLLPEERVSVDSSDPERQDKRPSTSPRHSVVPVEATVPHALGTTVEAARVTPSGTPTKIELTDISPSTASTRSANNPAKNGSAVRKVQSELNLGKGEYNAEATEVVRESENANIGNAMVPSPTKRDNSGRLSDTMPTIMDSLTNGGVFQVQFPVPTEDIVSYKSNSSTSNIPVITALNYKRSEYVRIGPYVISNPRVISTVRCGVTTIFVGLILLTILASPKEFAKMLWRIVAFLALYAYLLDALGWMSKDDFLIEPFLYNRTAALSYIYGGARIMGVFFGPLIKAALEGFKDGYHEGEEC